MGTNQFAPNGLSVADSRAGGAATYQNNLCTIKSGYGSSIGRGDLVNQGTGANAGYAVLQALADIQVFGVFGAVYPYYDTVQQGTAHGLIGSYNSGASPSADISAWLIDDPLVEFIAQVSGGPWQQSWRGQNINFLTGTNGAPNATGQSTLALDASTIATTNTLPLQILRVVGVTGGPQDPANTNPWIAVRLNTAALLQSTGR